jgi:hypothetical protein
LAFFIDKEPLVGSTYDPMSQELFHAIQAKRVFHNALSTAIMTMDAGYIGRSADVWWIESCSCSARFWSTTFVTFVSLDAVVWQWPTWPLVATHDLAREIMMTIYGCDDDTRRRVTVGK